MPNRVECIPNFSEGRDAALLADLAAALAGPGVRLLDRTADPDHHRSVFTVVGSLAGVEQAVVRAAAIAVERIDLTRHQGVHPRIGALDVIPLVPLDDTPRAACVEAAGRIGERLWSELGLPVYFYGEAARDGARVKLEAVRKVGFERLTRLVAKGECLPDIGSAPHPTAGACCIGVRDFMIAFNVHLASADAALAKRIANAVRESSGGLPGVKALGLYLPTRGVAQVSMNLTDLNRTPLHTAFEAVADEAAREGVRVVGSELIGLAPRRAIEQAAGRLLRIEGFNPSMILENRLETLDG